MPKAKKRKKKPEKKLVLGDDAIESFEADWLGFRTPAVGLAKHLYKISKTSGVCCGIIGPWGSGKSSFMRLMDEYIQKESSWKKVDVTWFTAWDPGGIQDLGDAMLYNFFRYIATKNQEMNGTFKELQKALGIRRSFKERASQVLEGVSGVIPTTTGRAVATAAGKILRELEAAKTVQDCFEKLMNWLEKENRTVFFFIDDIDRATGEQIRDLLSELKVYISHRRIVAILAFDEDYVLNALKPVLPSGIDPKKYLEKIVTTRRNVPVSRSRDLSSYAEQLLRSTLDIHEHVERLASLAALLSSNNPRRLKNLILTFTQLISHLPSKIVGFDDLSSSLIVTAALNMGFLANDDIMLKMENASEEEIISALGQFAKEDESKSKDADILIRAVRLIEPSFSYGFVTNLRLQEFHEDIEFRRRSRRRSEAFNWSGSLIPIVSNAAKRGFKIPPEMASSSTEIVVPPFTKTEGFKLPAPMSSRTQQIFRGAKISTMSWNQYDMGILLSSNLSRDRASMVVERFFEECAHFVSKKGYILWLIDDVDFFPKDYLRGQLERTKNLSKGLKHLFIFQYTLSSQIKPLLEFLLSVVSKTN